MKTVTSRGKQIEVPTHVSELSPKQYEYYCLLASALGSGFIDVDFFRVRWFSFLIGMQRSNFTMLKPEFIAELEEQLEAVDGFIIDSGGHVSLDFTTAVNLLPSYKGYNGPGDWLDGVTFGTFVECLTILENISEAEPDALLEGYEHIARRLYHIPDTDRVPDLLTFHAPNFLASVWRCIMSEPVEINGKKIDFRIIFRSSGQSKPDDHTGWTGITFEVAAAGLFGSVKEVEAADFWQILLYLYKCKFEYLHENRTQPHN